jgi:hypothetical protein
MTTVSLLVNKKRVNSQCLLKLCHSLSPRQNLLPLQCRTDHRQSSYFPRTIRGWNNLSPETVLAPSVSAFALRAAAEV